MGKRDNAILELLVPVKRLEVTAIAEALGVSQVTIRKDLDALEERGILRREHGYAILGGTDDINNRLAYHYEEKQLIAATAAELVDDGETVMIENGSCCALLAETLLKTKRDITIITNSAFIAGHIRALPGAHVILMGGDFQNTAQVSVGPLLKLCASQFHVSKLFIGVDGYGEEEGFMASDYMRVQAVRDMAEQARQVIVLSQSSKFNRTSVVALALPNGVQTLVTDNKLPNEAEQMLIKAGVRICRAKAE